MFATHWVFAYEVDDVVAAHESAVALIKRFDVVAVVRVTERDGSKCEPPVVVSRVRWSGEGERHRWQLEHSAAVMTNPDHPRQTQSDEPTRVDWFTNGLEDRLLIGWNPKAPKKISPWDQQGVAGRIGDAIPGRYHPQYPFGSAFALTQLAACPSDHHRTLREFVMDSPETRLESGDWRGRRTPKLVMKHPDTRTSGKFRDTVISVTFEPDTFMIARLEVEIPASAFGFKQHGTCQVERFRQFDGGAFLPEIVSAKGTYEGSSMVIEFAMDVAKSTVNRPLPDDALDFRFPEGCIVKDLTTLQGGVVTAHIWGADNRPAQSLRDLSELGPPPSDGEALEARRRWLTYAVYGVGVPLILGLIGYLVWRRWR
jgi:hypothetical protein